jgi:RNA polymerase sigma factor (sigma-70 family)
VASKGSDELFSTAIRLIQARASSKGYLPSRTRAPNECSDLFLTCFADDRKALIYWPSVHACGLRGFLSPFEDSGDLKIETTGMHDQELIQAFAERHSDAAFAELVNRYAGFVYASALRQVRQSDLAADVTQAVFLLLARKAPALRREVILSGWLFRTTRFLAARARRGEQRRQHREQEAAVMSLENQSAEPEETIGAKIGPHLDEALAALSESDRRAVLLRYFENHRMREVGERLGLGEEAAKKRVTRAVDKMRTFLETRGVTLSSVALGTALFDFHSHAVPAGLTSKICAAIGTGATATSATVAELVAGGLRDWLWSRTRSVLPWAAGLAAFVIGTAVLFSKHEPDKQLGLALESTAAGAVRAATTESLLPAPQPMVAATTNTERRLFLTVLDRIGNQPIANAQVLAHVWGGGKVEQTSEKVTGADGSCVFDVPPPPFSTIRIWLSAPGYVPLSMDWQAHEFSESDVFHVTRLTRGVVLNGEVRDEAGQPVVGAKINFGGPGINLAQRENVSFLPRFSARQTDAAGHFQSDQMPSEWVGLGGISVGISHRDFARETIWLSDPKQFATIHLVTLTPGIALRGQVIGPRGDPITGARLRQDEIRFGLETKTGLDGRFEFPHVKPGHYTLTVRAEGFAQLEKTLLAETNGPEVTLQLAAEELGVPQKLRPIHLVGTVVDAESNEPVARFRVLLNERRGVADRLLGEAMNGKFDWTTEIRYVQEFALAVEADGYGPQESDVRQLGDLEQKFEFRLQRGSDLNGVVLQPDGQPAANASVGLAADGKYGLQLTEGGKLMNYGHHVNRTTTDEHGRFSLRTMVGAERLLVAHPSGCAVLPAGNVTNIFIPLQAWGQIEGLLRVGSQPAANQPVNVGFGAVPGGDRSLSFDYNAKTDAEGRFHFRYVPPGVHRVQRLMKFFKGETGSIGFSHGEIVTVSAGETTFVEVGGKGRAVIGRLEFSAPVTNYDWSLDLQMLVRQRPDLPEVRWQDFHGDMQAHSRAYSARDSQIAKYYLAIEPDGTFRTDDVLPGNYTLQVRIKAPLEEPMAKDAWMQRRREIGGVDLPVVVPDTDSTKPMDLGSITISITNASSPATADSMVAPLQLPAKQKP